MPPLSPARATARAFTRDFLGERTAAIGLPDLLRVLSRRRGIGPSFRPLERAVTANLDTAHGRARASAALNDLLPIVEASRTIAAAAKATARVTVQHRRIDPRELPHPVDAALPVARAAARASLTGETSIERESVWDSGVSPTLASGLYYRELGLQSLSVGPTAAQNRYVTGAANRYGDWLGYRGVVNTAEFPFWQMAYERGSDGVPDGDPISILHTAPPFSFRRFGVYADDARTDLAGTTLMQLVKAGTSADFTMDDLTADEKRHWLMVMRDSAGNRFDLHFPSTSEDPDNPYRWKDDETLPFRHFLRSAREATPIRTVDFAIIDTRLVDPDDLTVVDPRIAGQLSTRARATASVAPVAEVRIRLPFAPANAVARSSVLASVRPTPKSIWDATVTPSLANGLLFRDQRAGLRFHQYRGSHYSLYSRELDGINNSENLRVFLPGESRPFYIGETDYGYDTRATGDFGVIFRVTPRATGTASDTSLGTLRGHLRLVYRAGSTTVVTSWPFGDPSGLATAAQATATAQLAARHHDLDDPAIEFAIIDSRLVDPDDLTV